jgi:hypothetical protein
MVASQTWEAEAWTFARAFLLPSWKVRETASPEALALRARVSKGLAAIRFAQFSRLNAKRPELAEVRALLESLRNLGKGDEARSRKLQQARTLWEALPQAEGYAPEEYRLCGIFLIAWAELDMLTQCGWLIRDGQVVAAMSIDG